MKHSTGGTPEDWASLFTAECARIIEERPDYEIAKGLLAKITSNAIDYGVPWREAVEEGKLFLRSHYAAPEAGDAPKDDDEQDDDGDGIPCDLICGPDGEPLEGRVPFWIVRATPFRHQAFGGSRDMARDVRAVAVCEVGRTGRKAGLFLQARCGRSACPGRRGDTCRDARLKPGRSGTLRRLLEQVTGRRVAPKARARLGPLLGRWFVGTLHTVTDRDGHPIGRASRYTVVSGRVPLEAVETPCANDGDETQRQSADSHQDIGVGGDSSKEGDSL